MECKAVSVLEHEGTIGTIQCRFPIGGFAWILDAVAIALLACCNAAFGVVLAPLDRALAFHTETMYL